MNLSKFTVKRPVFTIMAILIIVFLGSVSLGDLGLDLFPDLEFPVVAILTDYEGAAPEEIETLITRPIEDTVSTVDGLEGISSVSSPNQSMVMAEFSFGADMDFAMLDVREQIDLVRGFLPDEASDPIVVGFDPEMLPMVTLGISGDREIQELTAWAEDVLVSRLERLEGVATVDITGGREREIQVNVDQDKLHGYGLILSDLTETLQSENLRLPGGEIQDGRTALLTRTTGEFQSVAEIESLQLNESGLRLAEVAEVVDGESDIDQYTRINGVEGIGLSIQRESGANTVLVSQRISGEISEIQAENPDDINLNYVYDEAEFIIDVITNLAFNAAIGALIAIIVLYLFLRSIKTTIIIGLAIPISIVATFVLMFFADLTFNIMTLGGLALGIGMLVDNAIVVIENIYRLRQNGKEPMLAATEGSGEVAAAITASTLTTVAVFLPIVYIEGLASEIFSELAMTVAFSLLASLLVALSLIPMLASRMLNGRVSQRIDMSKLDRAGSRVKTLYGSFLEIALGHRAVTVTVVLLLFAGSMLLLTGIGAEFIPPMDEGEIMVEMELPQGMILSETRQVTLEVEEIIAGLPEVETVYTSIGAAGGQAAMLGLGGGASHQSSIEVSLVSRGERERSTTGFAEEIRQLTAGIPRADITVTDMAVDLGGMMGGAPIALRLQGPELDTLEEHSEELALLLGEVEGTSNVQTSFEEARPEVVVRVDRSRSSDLGIPAVLIAQTVNTGIDGQVASQYRVAGDEHDIRVRLAKSGRESLADLRRLRVASPEAGLIELQEIADIEVVDGPVQIDREDQERTARVTANLNGRDLGSVIEDIEAELVDYQLTEGYLLDITGEAEEMEEAFGDLFYAFALAVVLIYMIMAAQFESLVHPFAIMFSVPLALIGVVGGLFLTGHNLSVVSIIGVIMLVGIVVNNAIVLVDYVNILRRQGQSRRKALINAGMIRLRPITMTALTTMLALLPLAVGLGEGAEAQAPMAVVVIGGLLTSTFLTLIFLPVIYSLLDGFTERLKSLIS